MYSRNKQGIDYLVFQSNAAVIFWPVTPKATLAFRGLRVDHIGAYESASDAEAMALFDRLDAEGLNDLTLA